MVGMLSFLAVSLKGSKAQTQKGRRSGAEMLLDFGQSDKYNCFFASMISTF